MNKEKNLKDQCASLRVDTRETQQNKYLMHMVVAQVELTQLPQVLEHASGKRGQTVALATVTYQAL